MKSFFKKHDIWTKLLSIVIAISLWAFVMNEEESLERTVRYTVPLTLTGESLLLEDQNLVVIDGRDTKVTLTVTGTNPNIIKLTERDFAVTVDVSALDEAKTYTNLPYEITLPATSPSLKVKAKNPPNVQLTLDKMASMEVPITASCSEEAPDGYLYGEPVLSRQSVTVLGPESILSTIAKAHISIPTDKRTDLIREACTFTLLDKEANPVDTTYLSWRGDSVTVMVNTYVKKEVALKVSLRPSAEITTDMATVSIDPATVEVYGEADAMRQIETISLGTLDLESAQTGSQITKKISMPTGIRLMNGQPSQAKITLQIDGIATQTLNISNIALVDMNANEVKPEVTLETALAQVTVRGKNSKLNALSVNDVTVSAQFDSSTLENGNHMVPVSVSVKTSDITIVEYTQTVTIHVSDGTEEPIPPEEQETTPDSTITPEEKPSASEGKVETEPTTEGENP